jgi:hypothetical protein
VALHLGVKLMMLRNPPNETPVFLNNVFLVIFTACNTMLKLFDSLEAYRPLPSDLTKARDDAWQAARTLDTQRVAYRPPTTTDDMRVRHRPGYSVDDEAGTA